MAQLLEIKQSISSYFKENPEIKYILFGGKGGLGKTTLSAATSYWLARRGKKVCVFSTDPQASLSDIFERKIFGLGEVEIAPNLFALEIDADKRIADYQNEIRNKIKEMYKLDKIPEEIEEYISSSSAEPAMAESATFDAMVELMSSGKYDYYVFDMMPHGHAIRFLGMADILDRWVAKIMDVRKKAAEYGDTAAVLGASKGGLAQEDYVLNELEYIRGRLDFVSKVVRDKKTTAFFYVIIPELMPILDTRKAIAMFKEFQVEVSGVVVNQVYPLELMNQDVPEFLKNRIKSQRTYITQIASEFGDLIKGVVPMLDREPKGLDMISKVAELLYGEV